MAPTKLVLSTSSISSSDMRTNNLSRVIPAFATRTWIGPNSVSTFVKAASTLAVSETSQVTTFKPATGSPLRLVTMTVSPLARNSRAIASPMPLLPPVTNTIFDMR